MNKIRNSYSFIPLYSYFMNYAPVKEIVDKEGSDGLGVVTALLLHLLQFMGGIASLTDLKTLAVPMRKRKSFLLHIVTDYRMFRVTPDGQSFYSPYLREVMKLVLEIETADDYYQSTNNRQKGQDNAPSTASKRVGKSFANRLQMNSKSFANEYRKNENADNQAVSETNDDNMYNKDNKNNKDYYNKKTPSTTTKKKKKKEEEEEFFYEKNNFYNDSAKKRQHREQPFVEQHHADRESDSREYSYGEQSHADRENASGEYSYGEQSHADKESDSRERSYADRESASREYSYGERSYADRESASGEYSYGEQSHADRESDSGEYSYGEQSHADRESDSRERSYADRESASGEYSYGEQSYGDRESASGEYSYGEPHYAGRQRSCGEPPTDSGQRGNGTYSRRNDEPPFDAIVRSAGAGRQRSGGEPPTDSVQRGSGTYSRRDDEPPFDAIVRSAGAGRQRSGGEPSTDYGERGEATSERRYGEARRRLPEKVDRMFADAEWLRNIYEQGHTPLCWQKGQSTPESFAHCIEHIKRWFVQQVVCKGNPADSPQRLRYYFFNLMNPGSRTREECRHYVSDILQRERSLAAEGKTTNDGYDYEY